MKLMTISSWARLRTKLNRPSISACVFTMPFTTFWLLWLARTSGFECSPPGARCSAGARGKRTGIPRATLRTRPAGASAIFCRGAVRRESEYPGTGPRIRYARNPPVWRGCRAATGRVCWGYRDTGSAVWPIGYWKKNPNRRGCRIGIKWPSWWKKPPPRPGLPGYTLSVPARCWLLPAFGRLRTSSWAPAVEERKNRKRTGGEIFEDWFHGVWIRRRFLYRYNH